MIRADAANAEKVDGFWPLRPQKLYTLWDMMRFLLHQFAMDWEVGVTLLSRYKQLAATKPQQILVGDEFIEVGTFVRHMKFHCDQLKLEKSSDRLWRFELRLGKAACSYSFISTELEEVANLINFELDDATLAFIPPERAKYFEKDTSEALFGTPVWVHFPEAKKDIKDAGNCLASDLNDAAVFYLLRVVEKGLRELARNTKVKFPKTPLDYAGWDGIVVAIDKKLDSKLPKARGPKKSSALKFKHDLLADFKAFGVLRNEIMHGRSHHNEQEAIGLFNRVRDFMRQLDKHLFPVKKSKIARKSMWTVMAEQHPEITKKII